VNDGLARKVAVAEMRRALKRLAFDAAMYERYGATYPQAVSASRQRKRLLAAIAALEVNHA